MKGEKNKNNNSNNHNKNDKKNLAKDKTNLCILH